jgi:hypothetical protein
VPILNSNRFASLGLVVLVLLLTSFSSARHAEAQQAPPQVSFPITVEWKPRAGVRIWRLQVAADDKFQDIFLDRRVLGDRYLVSEIPSGYYFWRVAPADTQSYSTPQRFFISGGTVTAIDVSTRFSRVKPQRARRGRQ